jgi:hypothetical protein
MRVVSRPCVRVWALDGRGGPGVSFFSFANTKDDEKRTKNLWRLFVQGVHTMFLSVLLHT